MTSKVTQTERSQSKQSKKMEAGKPFPGSMGAKSFALIAGFVVVIDQITKYLVLARMPLYDVISIIPGFFNIIHIHNPGGAFGFMARGNEEIRNILFIGVSFVALGLIVYFYRTTPKTHRFLAAAMAMIFGGAVGNLIDRFRFGEVVDFLDFYLGSYHWPSFNAADSAITIGIVIFVAHVILGKMPE